MIVDLSTHKNEQTLVLHSQTIMIKFILSSFSGQELCYLQVGLSKAFDATIINYHWKDFSSPNNPCFHSIFGIENLMGV